ncbi:MAG: hypothetical protein QXI27_04000 [Nitrososphaerota archaeon]
MKPGRRKDVEHRRISEKVLLLGTYFKKVGHELLILGKNLPDLGDRVYDEKLREVGYVSNVFGRVENYFIIVRNLTNREFREGDVFYLIRREKQASQSRK